MREMVADVVVGRGERFPGHSTFERGSVFYFPFAGKVHLGVVPLPWDRPWNAMDRFFAPWARDMALNHPEQSRS